MIDQMVALNVYLKRISERMGSIETSLQKIAIILEDKSEEDRAERIRVRRKEIDNAR